MSPGALLREVGASQHEYGCRPRWGSLDRTVHWETCSLMSMVLECSLALTTVGMSGSPGKRQRGGDRDELSDPHPQSICCQVSWAREARAVPTPPAPAQGADPILRIQTSSPPSAHSQTQLLLLTCAFAPSLATPDPTCGSRWLDEMPIAQELGSGTPWTNQSFGKEEPVERPWAVWSGVRGSPLGTHFSA